MRQRLQQLLPKAALVSSASLVLGANFLDQSDSGKAPHDLKAGYQGIVASPVEEGVLASLRRVVGWTSDKAVQAPLPIDKLSCKRRSHELGKPYRPVVLLSCGSFNPPTVAHLRMFELAADELIKGGYDVLGGYMSPVNDAYSKKGLAPAQHRVEMCRLAAQTSDIAMVDSWEAEQPTYQRTLMVLQRLEQALNEQPSGRAGQGQADSDSGGTEQPSSSPRIKPMLLCGADMVESLAVPGVWKPEHVRSILEDYGVVCISREHSNVSQLMEDRVSPLHEFSNGILLVENPIINNISSTVLRQQLAQGRSIRYLVPDGVIEYIKKHQVYD
ncbi:g12073 [Coccomyxa viridis]|uniref:Nicotinamide-nucleotide adenylyltransferase n=1 Tax=Coccomyxa viridis TaxID=1274662 RepID=A0ABP1GAL0_9CHLO